MDSRSSQNNRRTSVYDSLLTGMRRLMVLAILLGLGFLALWFYAKHRVHEEIRLHVESALAQHYASRGIIVKVGAARLIEGHGIEVRGIVFARQSDNKKLSEIARVDELFVSSNIAIKDLLSMKPPLVDHVALRRMKLNLAREPDGTWDVEWLLPLPRMGESKAPVSIENSTIELRLSDDEQKKLLRLRDVFVTISQQESPEVFSVRGTTSSEDIGQFKFGGVIDVDTGALEFQGDMSDLQISPDLIASLPLDLPEPLRPLASLRGVVSCNFSAARGPDTNDELTFSVDGSLSHGQIDDPRLPHLVTDISTDLHCDNGGFRVENFSGQCGASTVSLSYVQQGFDQNSPRRLKINANELVLDQRIVEVLPSEIRNSWDKFAPQGTIDADVQLTFDGAKWTPNITVKCVDVSFAYYEFPYRVRGCIGTLDWKEDLLIVDLRALIGGRMARFEGRVMNPGPRFTGRVDVTLDGPITLNEELISAIKPSSQSVVRDFHPSGKVTFSGYIERQDLRQGKPDRKLVVQLLDCAVKHERFPYPIDRIRGTLEMLNGDWEFLNLEGFNDHGRITGYGKFRRDVDGRDFTELTFNGEEIPLDDELRSAMNPRIRQAWSDLRPRGTLDSVHVDWWISKSDRINSIEVHARKSLSEQQDVAGRSLTIYPVWFPYRMDEVTGVFRYRDGQVTLEEISAKHGDARISLAGQCNFTDDTWQVVLTDIAARSIRPDKDLIAALPGQLGTAISTLKVTGLMTIDGSLNVYKDADPRLPLRAGWDLNLDMEDGQLDCGLQFNEVRGAMHLAGNYNKYGFRSRGKLDIDSAMYKDIQLTAIRGPIWIDGFRVAFGRWARSGEVGETPPPLTAKVFGGTLEGDAQIATIGNSRFTVQGRLKGAELEQVARDLGTKVTTVTGKADAQIRLTGNKQGTYTLDGDGKVQVYNSDVYEVPLMISLLKSMSERRAERFAFKSSNMDFRIKGENIYFDRIDFSGDRFSLRGKGEMNLDRQINLTFYTILGRSEFQVPIVSPILGLASRQIWQIHVDGTLDNPNPPVREVLPGLNESLRQLFPELETPRNSIPDRSALSPRKVLDRGGLLRK